MTKSFFYQEFHQHEQCIAAISLPELLILRKVIKWQALVLFAGIVTVSIIFVGWFFNFIV
jgi:uncharacterized membrane protein YraQ (UPF0718 family)